jgi:hypothetical protein
MPIRINLLAEALAEEDLRRRDPVKRSIYGGAFLVALSLVWFSSTWLEYMVDKQKLNQIDGEIETHTNDYAQVQANLRQIGNIQKRLDSLDQLTGARFLQGNLLNALQQTYVPNVQLNHLRVDQSYSTVAALPAKTNSFGVVLAGRPAAVTEHVNLTMDAKDFSPNPGDQVQHFKDALFKQDYFKTCLESNGIRLSALSALQTPLDGKPYVLFSVECRFKDRP